MDVVASYVRDHQSRLIANDGLREQIDLVLHYVREHQSRLIVHDRMREQIGRDTGLCTRA